MTSTEAPRRDVLRILGLRQWLKGHPEKHQQKQWLVAPDSEFDAKHQDARFDCGTTACAAGWTSLLAGDVLSRQHANLDHRDSGTDVFRVAHVLVDGVARPIGMRAAELLGLTHYVATALFHHKNDNPAVLKALKMLGEGESDRKVFNYLAALNPNVSSEPISLGR